MHRLLAYGPLAAWYDKLTLDVPYEEFLGFYEREFKADGGDRRIPEEGKPGALV